MIKLWSGPGKRSIKNKRKQSKAQESKSLSKIKSNLPLEQIPQYPEKRPQNVIDYETLQKMYYEYNKADYKSQMAAGDEISTNSYAKKCSSLKFLSL